ncbi:hypothetical protein CBR_g13061 [Chara braunii]|uniref:Reverse transcriptase/retrotransposon-derived protein RNase H-like domain-containing protein n=1 Tax=Chara braunii TaxID=69332 RepID=A0A388KTE6_CHABU|nr:hypothetical protein CBR_g13061 [Chara braunii]|eukprot:GBG73340.1 hypothetical protein CBR_g13061 [Chara braunii]
MVDTRSGKSTAPQSEAEHTRIAAILRERNENEFLKQVKLKAIAEEQAAKKKKLEEEMIILQKEKMMMLQQEEEEKRKVAEEEAAEEEEVEEEPLERRRGGDRGETSGTKEEDKWMEKKISEWVANLSLGEDEEAQLEFACDVVTHVGTEVKRLKEGVDKFCAGAIESAKVVVTAEAAARPRKEPIKLKFPDAYSGKKDDSFDNWEANINTYVYLQHIAPEEQVLVAFHALKDKAAASQGPSRVLQKLRESNFKINAKKCEWAKTQVLYLGHVLDGDGIKPEDSKIAAIRDWPTPSTLTELRSFLGLANYYRKFVRNFSTIAAPLRRLLKKEAIWQWDKDCTSALKKLKRALIEYPVLKVADPSLPFVVTTGVSQYGIGAVLQQDDGNGYRPVEFMSARMPSEKVATSTYERELYALRQALEHWKHYLLGRHFKVYSNHETLRWLRTQAKMTPKLTRWAAEIDQYDFELKPVKGKYNVVADALSKRSDYFGAIVHYLDIGSDLQEKDKAYAQAPIYSDLKRVKEAPETEPDYRRTEGLLFEKTDVVRVCVPNSAEIRSLILGECRDTEGHFGWQKTLANLMYAYLARNES